MGRVNILSVDSCNPFLLSLRTPRLSASLVSVICFSGQGELNRHCSVRPCGVVFSIMACSRTQFRIILNSGGVWMAPWPVPDATSNQSVSVWSKCLRKMFGRSWCIWQVNHSGLTLALMYSWRAESNSAWK